MQESGSERTLAAKMCKLLAADHLARHGAKADWVITCVCKNSTVHWCVSRVGQFAEKALVYRHAFKNKI